MVASSTLFGRVRHGWIAPLLASLMILPAGVVLAPHGAGASLAPPSPAAPALSGSPAGSLLAALHANGPPGAPRSLLPSTLPGFPTRSVGDFRAPLPSLTSSSTASPLLPSVPAGAAVASVQQTRSLIAAGTVPARAAYLPSLSLLSGPVQTPAQAVSPLYQVGPAPMGLADYGLGPGGTNYSVYTPDVLGTMTLFGYNATAGPLYEDTGAYYWSGLSPNSSVSPWQSGVQLNTVVTNVSYPGANNGSFWTQNVLDFSGDTVQLIDNIWNFSNPAASFDNGTLFSFNGTPVYPEFYYDLGPTLPLAFPLTVQLYNNVSNVAGRTTVTFGYRLTEPSHAPFTGIYDTVAFNSRPNLSTPLRTPAYLVTGDHATPAKLLYDAEIVFGGPGAGSNAVINGANGTLALSYREGTSWKPASSAYSYGTDTGETAIGLAGWWAGATEHINQGPSLLNGLWNTTGGVPHGWIAVDFSLTPSFAFGFIGGSLTDEGNLSYAPSGVTGELRTWLPPVAYKASFYADGFLASHLLFVGNSTGTITLTAAAGVWNAPLYMTGTTQAEALAAATVGWTSGPLVFENLLVNVSLVFNHANDFYFPEFGLFSAIDVSSPPIELNNVSQGPDLGSQTVYLTSRSSTPTIDAPGLGGTITFWACQGVSVSHLDLPGVPIEAGVPAGGAVALWDTPNVRVVDVRSTGASFGVWAADSPGVLVEESSANDSANVLSLMDSPGAFAEGLNATGFAATGVLAVGSDAGAFDLLNASFGAYGYAGIFSNFETLSVLNASTGALGALVLNSTDVSIASVNASGGALGVGIADSSLVAVQGVNASWDGVGPFATLGVQLNNTFDGFLTNLSVNSSFGVVANNTSFLSVQNETAVNGSIGGIVNLSTDFRASNLLANDSLGFAVVDNLGPSSFSNVTSVNGSTGVEAFQAEGVHVDHVTASGAFAPPYFPAIGVWFVRSDGGSVSNVTAAGLAEGVNVTESNGTIVQNVSAVDEAEGLTEAFASNVSAFQITASGLGAAGVYVAGSFNVSVTGLAASFDSFGAFVFGSTDVRFDQTSARNQSVGVIVIGSNDSFVHGTSAVNGSVAVGLEVSNDSWVNSTSASNFSVGVALFGTNRTHVDQVTAVDPFVTSPWNSPYFGLPVAAVVSQRNYQSTIADVQATDYPAGLLDWFSDDLAVSGLNASFGDLGVLLNGTFAGLFTGISAYADAIGFQMNDDAFLNVVTQSAFVNDSGFGVDIESGFANLVYDNSFVGDNGAGTTYNATHLQAFSSSSSNAFNDSVGIGNYWADWHTYANGVLAPYFVGSGAWDYHPLGAAEGTYLVTFQESGLSPGANWSVTLDGTTQASQSGSIAFAEAPGVYNFSVSAPSDYQVLPASGSVVVSTGPVGVNLSFAALYPVTFTESGLSGANWTVYLNGVPQSGAGPNLTFEVPAGSYAYQVVAPPGWAASPSAGSVNVGASYTVPVAFTSTSPTTTVTITEQGLGSGTRWSVVFGGVQHSSSGRSLSFSVVSGSYAYQVEAVANYTASPGSGSVDVSGATYLLVVAFAPVTYSVTFAETGLAPGTVWSVTVGGTEYTTSATSVSVQLANGTTQYSYHNVSGYTLGTAGAGVVVNGGPTGVLGAYAPTSTPSFVPKGTFDQDLAIALGLGAVGALLGLVALLRRPSAPRPPPPSPPVTPASPRSAPAEPPAPAPWSETTGPER